MRYNAKAKQPINSQKVAVEAASEKNIKQHALSNGHQIHPLSFMLMCNDHLDFTTS